MKKGTLKKRDNLDDNDKEQFKKYEKKRKKVMRDSLDDEKKEHLKKRTIKDK